MIHEMEVLEHYLTQNGAKGFKDLHPAQWNSPQTNHNRPGHGAAAEPFQIEFSFLVADLNDTKREGYLQL